MERVCRLLRGQVLVVRHERDGLPNANASMMSFQRLRGRGRELHALTVGTNEIRRPRKIASICSREARSRSSSDGSA
jgi:hypothetical protein